MWMGTDRCGLYKSWISLVVSGQSRNTEEVYIYIRTYSGYPNITCSPIHSLLRIPIICVQNWLQSYQLNSLYINLTLSLHFIFFLYWLFFRISQYFLSFRYIFHLLIDYLSIYQNTTQSCQKDIRRNFNLQGHFV